MGCFTEDLNICSAGIDVKQVGHGTCFQVEICKFEHITPDQFPIILQARGNKVLYLQNIRET